VTPGVLVIAKNPVPGRVKTRLQPQFSADEAAALAGAALHDVWDWAGAAPWRCMAIDSLGESLPGWLSGDAFPQVAGNLGDRITAALSQAASRHGPPLLLVGMDTPQLTEAHLQEAADMLARSDYVLGLAPDGGFWALGASGRAVPDLGEVAMSRADTGANTLALLAERGRVGLLAELEDVDDEASALRVAQAAPDSRFARTLHGIRQ